MPDLEGDDAGLRDSAEPDGRFRALGHLPPHRAGRGAERAAAAGAPADWEQQRNEEQGLIDAIVDPPTPSR